MTQDQIYQNIAQRTGGDIYIGVVGPVRSGKSSFIKRFAEQRHIIARPARAACLSVHAIDQI